MKINKCSNPDNFKESLIEYFSVLNRNDGCGNGRSFDSLSSRFIFFECDSNVSCAQLRESQTVPPRSGMWREMHFWRDRGHYRPQTLIYLFGFALNEVFRNFNNHFPLVSESVVDFWSDELHRSDACMRGYDLPTVVKLLEVHRGVPHQLLVGTREIDGPPSKGECEVRLE